MARRVFSIILLLLVALAAACRKDDVPAPTPAETASVDLAVTPGSAAEPAVEAADTTAPTDIPPSPTPVSPLAATVNGQPIFLADYEKELSRYERAQAELGGANSAEGNNNYRTVVLDALVERALITQAAAAQGMVVTPEMVDGKIAELQAAAGDTGNFEAWLEANQWTLDEFREALAAEMLTEQVVSAVTAGVPFAVEQVRARYLQVDDLALAQSLLAQIRNGTDFAELASMHSLDRLTAQNGGDLGFFARGSLLVPSVEEAAFALNPGEVSEIITDTGSSDAGVTYYLVQVIERDPQRPLTADLRYKLLQETFESWLSTLWEQATIVRFVDTDL